MTASGGLPPLDAPVDLAPSTVADFAAHGHAVVRGLARADEVAAYRPAIRAAVAARGHDPRPLDQRDTYGRAFQQSMNLWRLDPDVARFVCAPRFAAVAAALLGAGGVRLYHDQALLKEPGGGHTPWHQDQVYWPLDPPATVTMWMPLVDVDDAVGSMSFACGSHRLGDLGAGDISDRSERDLAAAVAARGLATETHGALAAGDATFHAGWVLHRAGPNPTRRLREVMTVIYVADGVRVTEPNPGQRFDAEVWLKGLAPGDPVDGPRHPLLWPAG